MIKFLIMFEKNVNYYCGATIHVIVQNRIIYFLFL